jgi:hypothetical protein
MIERRDRLLIADDLPRSAKTALDGPPIPTLDVTLRFRDAVRGATGLANIGKGPRPP